MAYQPALDLEKMTQQVLALSETVAAFIRQQAEKISSKDVEVKGSHDYVTYVDKTSEKMLVEGLKEILPEAGFIAEEGTEKKEGARYNWIVDPLDGTTNFIHGIPFYCISIALQDKLAQEVPVAPALPAAQAGIKAEKEAASQTDKTKDSERGCPTNEASKLNQPTECQSNYPKTSMPSGNPFIQPKPIPEGEIILGLVHHISMDEKFYAFWGSPAYLNGKPIHVSPLQDLDTSLIVTGFPYYDFERLDGYMDLLKETMRSTAGVRRLGSAALDLAAVAAGRSEVFFEYCLKPWDVAAGQFIVKQAGGQVCDFAGGNHYLHGREIVCGNPGILAKFLKMLQKYVPSHFLVTLCCLFSFLIPTAALNPIALNSSESDHVAAISVTAAAPDLSRVSHDAFPAASQPASKASATENSKTTPPTNTPEKPASPVSSISNGDSAAVSAKPTKRPGTSANGTCPPELPQADSLQNPAAETTEIQATDIRTTPTLYRFTIDDEIGPAAARLTKKALNEASEQNADYILLELNTFGGTLKEADEIRTLLLECPIPTLVYININAASAGALISIACDSIYMNPAATIGAATVVDAQGEVQADKYQSYMRAMMRATAEATGRDPHIAEAMVDERISIKGISDSGKVLTFTASEALQHHYCQGIYPDAETALQSLGLDQSRQVKQELKATDKIIHFLVNPFVSGILIMMIIGGIYFELQTPGIGFALGVAVLGCLLYFAPHYLEGLASHWEILIFLVGLVLIVLEIFVIPGFGVAGISGIFLVCAGLTLALVDNWGLNFSLVNPLKLLEAAAVVVVSTVLTLIIGYKLSLRLFGRRVRGYALALDSEQKKEDGFVSVAGLSDYQSLVGREAIAESVLRPAGKINIDGELYDATSESGFIEKGSKVKTQRFENAQFFVRKI